MEKRQRAWDAFWFGNGILKSLCGCLYSHEKWAMHVPWLMFQFSLSCFTPNKCQYSQIYYIIWCFSLGSLVPMVPFFLPLSRDFHSFTVKHLELRAWRLLAFIFSMCVNSHFNAQGIYSSFIFFALKLIVCRLNELTVKLNALSETYTVHPQYHFIHRIFF